MKYSISGSIYGDPVNDTMHGTFTGTLQEN